MTVEKGSIIACALVLVAVLTSQVARNADAAPFGGDGGDDGRPLHQRQPIGSGRLQFAALRQRRDALRHLAPAATQANADEQQALEDETRAIRRQLPDLIAQAHSDKVAERALLKLLISASLRSALGNLIAPQANSAAQSYANGATSNGWPAEQSDGAAGRQVPIAGASLNWMSGDSLARLARLEAEGVLDSLAADSVAPQDQLIQSAVEKREYIKPCSFNAISCGPMPFRKL